MPATNSTTHYELPIFIGTDKPSWMGDWNGAMNKIDAALAEANANATAAMTTANAASTTAQAAQTSVSAMETKVTSLETEQTSIQQSVMSVNEALQDLQQQFNSFTPYQIKPFTLTTANSLNTTVQGMGCPPAQGEFSINNPCIVALSDIPNFITQLPQTAGNTLYYIGSIEGNPLNAPPLPALNVQVALPCVVVSRHNNASEEKLCFVYDATVDKTIALIWHSGNITTLNLGYVAMQIPSTTTLSTTTFTSYPWRT